MRRDPCVLIVDDDGDVRSVLSELLTDEGYSVVTAENGAAALRLLKSGERPCVILLDLMMPVMDGWELAAALRSEPELSGIPWVVISAAYEARPMDARFLAKPIDLDSLLATVAHDCGS